MKTFNTSFTSFAQMLEVLPNDKACREFLETVRWEGTPVCPHCGSINKEHYELKTKGVFNGLRKCKDCKERFTVTVGTMFEGSHIKLRKWFIAIYIATAHKKGISSLQLSRDINVTQKTAWFMLQRIRHTFSSPAYDTPLGFNNPVEIDETVYGGSDSNKHKGKPRNSKTMIVGAVERGGNVVTEVQVDTKYRKVVRFVYANVIHGADVMTDTAQHYRNLGTRYSHNSVNHTEKEYVRGNYHTQTIEGFWSLLKRGINGIYHSVSPKHLHKYVDEYAFRYNTRKMNDAHRFGLMLANPERQLSYKKLIGKK